MKESRVWKYLEEHLPDYIKAERMEVMTPPGLSDVFWTDTRTSISGWLELKHCESDDSEFRRGRIPHLKPEQPMFLRRQAENAVPCGILLRAGSSDWLFWRACPSREWVEEIRSTDAIVKCDAAWTGFLSGKRLFQALGCRLPL